MQEKKSNGVLQFLLRFVQGCIIGVGGISSAEDVLEFLNAGASAVEVGAANLVDPYASVNIVRELPSAMAKLGIERLSDIIGAAHK